jgi:peroxiredoxin
MVSTASTMLELGTSAPAFTLPEPLSGKSISLNDYAGKPILIAFVCNHCPYVLHILDAFTEFTREYKEKGLETIAINANDVENYPDDSPEKMAELAKQKGFSFPYLFDDSQDIAKAYRAACTPDYFLFDKEHTLVYRGQFDSARPKNDSPITGADMRAAANTVLNGEIPGPDQIASLGCNIKWKDGNSPDYFG